MGSVALRGVGIAGYDRVAGLGDCLHGCAESLGVELGALCTWGLLCSAFLARTCCLIRDASMAPKKELNRSLQVVPAPASTSFCVLPGSRLGLLLVLCRARSLLGRKHTLCRFACSESVRFVFAELKYWAGYRMFTPVLTEIGWHLCTGYEMKYAPSSWPSITARV